jgi:hypothetical protein
MPSITSVENKVCGLDQKILAHRGLLEEMKKEQLETKSRLQNQAQAINTLKSKTDEMIA